MHYGENKVQEALEKWSEIKENNDQIKLHLIGKLQSNKVKFAVKLFDYIHSLDSEKLAKKISDIQNQNNISQVRFVAVDTKYQKKGFGKLIIKAAENESQKNGNKKMILHSRDYSLDFYKKIGYKKIKKSYKLFDVIQHYLMEKTY